MAEEEGVVGGVVGLLEAKMRTIRKMKMWVLVEIKGMTVSAAPFIKIMETNEEEEASRQHVFIVETKAIELMNALNTKEG